MSDDEAINYLKEDIELYEDGCFISTDDDFKAIRIILNLLDKKQKEIKEYDYYKAEYERLEDIEEKYDKALKEIETLKHLKGLIRIDNNGKMELLKLTDFISKNKIKEKIKELELRKSFSDDFTEDYYLDQIDILQELLGE